MSSRARPSRTDFGAFRRELRRDWRGGTELTILETIDSTNALAKRTLASRSVEPLAAPLVFVAWSQTAGRGRRDRSWSSPGGGGIYASVLTPLHHGAVLETLPVLLPVVACAALRASGVRDCGLKWPNDLLIGGKKLGGFLVEAVTVGNQPSAAILGMGVNYETPTDPDLTTPAIGLVEVLRPLPTLAAVARRLLKPLVDRIAGFETVAMSELIGPYRALCVHRFGERLACRTAAETVEGDFAGFDDHGFLRLLVDADERLIGSGEIVERRDG